MTIAKNIEAILAKSSWIRKMFEEGARLKALHGADKVFDFSLGNPNLEPPDAFQRALKNAVDASAPGSHGYMPNSGYPHVCEAVAAYLSDEQEIRITGKEVIMTCGAAGALNVILKTILDPGDEVITPAPYFVEYNFYASNPGGVLKTVPTRPDFTLDCNAIDAAITAKTKAVLINSPNNPTGQIYSKESLAELGALLRERSKRSGRTIYLISDEPYRKIVYDGAKVPSIFSCYPDSIMATSYSKDISVPGERIGFLAVGPDVSSKNELMAGMALANRILGFVSAPALMQRVIAAVQGASVDVSVYARKRDLLCDGLAACGYEFTKPAGAFYLFAKTPDPDDVKFVRMLQEELILTVPGSGFGGPGHFRIAYCVDDKTIRNALPGFKKVRAKF
ncbi:MAG: pyridoxal phosphate-dependent aminotransferase [Thermodesulfobacteriota bacterium]